MKLIYLLFLCLITENLYSQSIEYQSFVNFANKLNPVGKILDLSEQKYVVWDCSPIYDSNGKVHVFLTRVPNSDGNWFQSFRTRGEIVHAVADRPEGPYTVFEVVRKGKGPGHWDAYGIVSPRIYKINNEYALFFTAYEIPWPLEKMKEHIGLLISDDLQHWRLANQGQPVLSPDTVSNGAWDGMIVNNAAFVKNPVTNQYCLYYRGMKSLNQWNIGLAVSNKLEGPYIRHSENPLIDASKLKKNFIGFEDPVVWYENSHFCMLAKDGGYLDAPGGCYFESGDGIHWTPPMRGWYSPDFYLHETGKLESPQILKNEKGEPEYIFFNRYIEKNQESSGFVFKIDR